MARRRYFRYYPRTRVAKKKWASNFRTFGLSTSTPFLALVENKTQPGAPTPTIIKCGNFKIHGDASVVSTGTGSSGILLVTAFVLFVPEGYTQTNISTIPTDHPEWIMAWTTLDLPVTNGTTETAGNKFSFSSRLKRNLNSGDKVGVFFSYGGASSTTVTLAGACQYWTCSN